MKAHRSKRYCDWLRIRFRVSQYPGPFTLKAEDLSHPPRHRPWIGEISPGRFAPGKEKGSDYGCLMLAHIQNMRESASDKLVWPTFYGNLPERDIIALSNLCYYVEEELDPGINLFAEMLEWTQKRVKELEDVISD